MWEGVRYGEVEGSISVLWGSLYLCSCSGGCAPLRVVSCLLSVVVCLSCFVGAVAFARWSLLGLLVACRFPCFSFRRFFPSFLVGSFASRLVMRFLLVLLLV
jgi:hypothetical protein